jgi:Flp pilus assembly protein TadD
MGRQDQALIELVMASLLGVEDAETLGVMGQLHLNASRYTTAEAVLRRAVALQPDAAQPRYALGSTLLRLGKTDEAKSQLAEFQRLRAAALDEQRHTFEIESLVHEANLHSNAGRHEQAVAVWRTIVEREPRRADRLAGLGGALVRNRQLDEAARYFEEAIALGADADVYRQLAGVYTLLGRADEGARALAVYKQRRQSQEQGR